MLFRRNKNGWKVEAKCNLSIVFSYWCLLVAGILFKTSSSTMAFVWRNKNFHILNKGLEWDGWSFVLLKWSSSVPSSTINYAFVPTNIFFFVYFLILIIIGCIPMILYNNSIGSLTNVAVTFESLVIIIFILICFPYFELCILYWSLYQKI